MPKTDRHRALYVLKYLWEHTDEEHPVMLAQIISRMKRISILEAAIQYGGLEGKKKRIAPR